MRLDHIIIFTYDSLPFLINVHLFSGLTFYPLFTLLIMPGGHSGEVIPVPIPNTEVKLSYVDDTAL